ncbi:roadblock/LC7 domain-containing protein [Streptomyces pathocidini]|uniref:Roadblock/LC7 domain-containing protein n=1 Tax=Streptomyces pathocidini TaxID=1650571 RepID=A0ABW7UNE0_9ACTN|nr:roadblock/LC7 domain-containing protein [Streptomyces pathocidini]
MTGELDWFLEDLAKQVPQTRRVIWLSSDGLVRSQHGCTREEAEHLAAIGSGLKSLSAGAGAFMPIAESKVTLIVLAFEDGILYQTPAADNSSLMVTADAGVDDGLMAQRMSDLVKRLGDHLKTPARGDGQDA